MTILKCDRCGKEIDPSTAMIVDVGTYKYHRTVEPKRHELCNECTEQLNIWLENTVMKGGDLH